MIAKHVPMRSVNRSALARLVGYIVDTQHKQERLGAVQVSNCASDEPLYAATEILNTQMQNVRAKSDKTYHLIISFRSEESPDDPTLRIVEERLCAALGFAEHQRISAVHRDTDNLHIHVAINKIHPVRYTMHEPYNDFWLLARSCERLEADLRLAPDNHTPKRSSSENRAADMEHHAGTESLIGWIQRQCADQMRQAETWEDLHDVMRNNGLSLRARGNGLAITADDGTSIKASSVGRDCSKASLEERLGPFRAAPIHPRQAFPARHYAQRPLHERIDTTQLYAIYQQNQRDANAARLIDNSLARAHKNRAVAAAKRSARLKRAAIVISGSDAPAKKTMYAAVGHVLLGELKNIAATHRRARKQIEEAHRRSAWADWLRARAEAGDGEALAALRARPGAAIFGGGALSGMTTRRSAAPQAPIDGITKQGTVIYRAAGATIRDDGKALHVAGDAEDAVLRAALAMAADMYGNRLHVNGSAGFRTALAKAAADMPIAISFDDKELDEHRIAFGAAANGAKRRAEEPISGANGNRSASATPRKSNAGESNYGETVTGDRRIDGPATVSPAEAARCYAQRRERERPADGAIPQHRVFDGPDRKLSYAGVASESGHVLALLREGDTIRVVPIDEKTSRALARKRPGTLVDVRNGGVAIGGGRKK